MNSETVTVLLPTYQRGNLLKRAILSVLEQTYENFILVICDNCSQDNTKNIVESFLKKDSRVKYFRQRKNIGLNKNFNFAVNQVNTPFFCFLTDDDYYTPNFLSDCMKAFKKFPEVKFSVLSAPTINENGKVLSNHLSVWSKNKSLYFPGEGLKKVLLGYQPIFTVCIFRKEISHELFFNEKFNMMSDIPILISCTAKYHYCISHKVGAYFIRHPKAAGFSKMKLKEIFNQWTELEKFFSKDSSINEKEKKLIKYVLKARNNKYFWNVFLKAFKYKNWQDFYFIGKKLLKRPTFSKKILCRLLITLSRQTSITNFIIWGIVFLSKTKKHLKV